MVKITSINVDGVKIKREFNSIGEVLKNWWSEEGTDLPGGDDQVLSFFVNGKELKKNNFYDCIQELEEIFWNEF